MKTNVKHFLSFIATSLAGFLIWCLLSPNEPITNAAPLLFVFVFCSVVLVGAFYFTRNPNEKDDNNLYLFYKKVVNSNGLYPISVHLDALMHGAFSDYAKTNKLKENISIIKEGRPVYEQKLLDEMIGYCTEEETINDTEKLSALRVWLNDRIDQDCKMIFDLVPGFCDTTIQADILKGKNVYGDKSYLTDDDITTLKKDFNKSDESKPN